MESIRFGGGEFRDNIMFIVLGVIYTLIIVISYRGDYKSREIEKQEEEWERIMGRRYY